MVSYDTSRWRFTKWLAAWVQPHSRITDPEQRLQSHLLSMLLLAMVVTIIVLAAYILSLDPADILDTRLLAACSSVVIFLLFFSINRAGYYRTAQFLTITYLTVGLVIIPYMGRFATFMPFMVVPMILVSMFYRWRYAAYVSVGIIVAAFVLNEVVNVGQLWDRRQFWYYLLFAGSLILVFKAHLINLERLRRKRIEEAQAAREEHAMELAIEQERSETFRVLVGNIAHDIGTPLAVINTNLYIINKSHDPQQQQAKLDTIRLQVETLETFTDDLMAMARLSSTPDLRLAWVDVNALVRGICADFDAIAQQHSLTMMMYLAEDLSLIQADQADIRRAISNLIGNAIRYTKDGMNVIVRTKNDVQNIVIVVEDEGIGIHEDDLPQIFERFFRASDAQQMTGKGSGLGLTIVQRVVDMHHGEIDVTSRVGEGSMFRVRLPILQGDLPAPPADAKRT